MDDINVFYSRMTDDSNELLDCSETIKSDCARLNEYLEELDNYWQGSAEIQFSNKIKEYIDYFEKCELEIKDNSERITEVKQAYEDLEKYFLNMKIA